MDRLARILLQMQPLDPDNKGGAIVTLDLDLTLANDRVLELTDLIALRQVGIEIVLAVKPRPQIDLGIKTEASPHSLLDTVAIDHGQHAGHGRINQRDLLIRPCAKADRRAAEQLGM